MSRFSIGVMVDSFRLPVAEGVRKAREVGADGLQVYVVNGEMAVERLSAQARRDFLSLVRDQGLTISALCGDLGGHGFQLPHENERKIAKSKAIVDLANDLETAVVTTHIGVIPEDHDAPAYRNQLAVCRELGRYAADHGVTFAIETGPEPAQRLRDFLDRLDTPGIGVNYDPANLVMVQNDDPVRGVRTLAPYIVHTHAKDGVMLHRGNPEYIYGVVHPVPQEFQGIQYFAEVPLGQGNVHFDTYLRALDEVGYRGFLTIEREVGEDPAADIRLAVAHLKANMKD